MLKYKQKRYFIDGDYLANLPKGEEAKPWV